MLATSSFAARLSQSLSGSPAFTAPEVLAGRAGAPAADIYALSATLFALLTGQPPFPGPTPEEVRRQAVQSLPLPDPRLACVPDRIERLLRSGLSPDPLLRPRAEVLAGELRAGLNHLLADRLAQGRAPGAPRAPVSVQVRVLKVSRSSLLPVPLAPPSAGVMVRDLKRVPPEPGRVVLHTGDRVRLEVVADRDGHLTVFNIGPTGTVNLLYPERADSLRRPGAPASP